MTIIPAGRTTRISFATDMTKRDAAVIPLAYMVEGVWPDSARWLGMIFRTRLTPLELDRVNLKTWPQLENPADLLSQLFEKGWRAAWGEAGLEAEKVWSRSALRIVTDDYSLALTNLRVDSGEAWVASMNSLSASLDAFRVNLAPSLIAPVAQMPTIPRRTTTESRTRNAVDEKLAA